MDLKKAYDKSDLKAASSMDLFPLVAFDMGS